MNGACRSFIWGMLGACMAVFAQTGASGPQGSAPSADSVPAAPVVKPSLAVLPTVYPERFKPVMRLSERFSAGGAEGLRTIFTTEHEVDTAVDELVRHVNKLREMSPLWEMAQEGIDLKSIEWAAH